MAGLGDGAGLVRGEGQQVEVSRAGTDPSLGCGAIAPVFTWGKMAQNPPHTPFQPQVPALDFVPRLRQTHHWGDPVKGTRRFSVPPFQLLVNLSFQNKKLKKDCGPGKCGRGRESFAP